MKHTFLILIVLFSLNSFSQTKAQGLNQEDYGLLNKHRYVELNDKLSGKNDLSCSELHVLANLKYKLNGNIVDEEIIEIQQKAVHKCKIQKHIWHYLSCLSSKNRHQESFEYQALILDSVYWSNDTSKLYLIQSFNSLKSSKELSLNSLKDNPNPIYTYLELELLNTNTLKSFLDYRIKKSQDTAALKAKFKLDEMTQSLDIDYYLRLKTSFNYSYPIFELLYLYYNQQNSSLKIEETCIEFINKKEHPKIKFCLAYEYWKNKKNAKAFNLFNEVYLDDGVNFSDEQLLFCIEEAVMKQDFKAALNYSVSLTSDNQKLMRGYQGMCYFYLNKFDHSINIYNSDLSLENLYLCGLQKAIILTSQNNFKNSQDILLSLGNTKTKYQHIHEGFIKINSLMMDKSLKPSFENSDLISFKLNESNVKEDKVEIFVTKNLTLQVSISRK